MISAVVLAAAARLALDPALSAIEPFPVEGANPRRWEKPLAFGPWKVGSLDEPGTSGFAAQALHLGGGYAKTPYRFRVEGPGIPLDVECFAKDAKAWFKGFQADVRQASGLPALACAFRDPDGAVTTFEMKSKGTGKFVGAVASNPPLEVRSEHRLEGSRVPLGDPAGYVLQRGDAVVGTVETLNRGRVWLRDGTAIEAATAAALLLFVPPDAGEMELER
jgi:hypothetical protein